LATTSAASASPVRITIRISPCSLSIEEVRGCAPVVNRDALVYLLPKGFGNVRTPLIDRVALSILANQNQVKEESNEKELTDPTQVPVTVPNTSQGSSGSAKVPIATVQGRQFLGNFRVGGWRVKVNAKTNQTTLYRMLLAALAYEKVGISLEEVICLNDLQQRMEKKLGSDPSFTAKWKDGLLASFNLVGKMRAQSFPYLPPQSLRSEMVHNLPKDFLPTPNAYFGWAKNPARRSQIRIIVPNPLTPPRRIPEKRRIGVGYKDSGNRRDPAKDGVTYKDLMKSPEEHIKGSPTYKESLTERMNKLAEVERKDRAKPGPRSRG